MRGTLDAPEPELSSEPPLDDTDILSLIVFSQPTTQLGAGQHVALGRRAAALAVGDVTCQLAATLGDALRLDVFEIETQEQLMG